jgi:nitrate/TMAO reductase-like tetraheme cytochrome c subunit
MIVKVNRSHLAALVLLIFACASWDVLAGPKKSRETATESSSGVTSDSSTQLSGQELWSMNCQRCHNMRPPTMYSDAQWAIIVHHMRVRANITGAEQRAIADFLKSGSP